MFLLKLVCKETVELSIQVRIRTMTTLKPKTVLCHKDQGGEFFCAEEDCVQKGEIMALCICYTDDE